MALHTISIAFTKKFEGSLPQIW